MGLLSKIEDRSSAAGSLRSSIIRFHERHSGLNCIVFENHKGNTFLAQVSGMLSGTGDVVPLSSGRALVLLPGTLDRELIAHRLSKSLNISPLLSFEARESENVINQIKPM
jgi:hypothetical protein